MNRNRGFTLIELLVAVAIVGLLASVAIPAYNGHVHNTRRANAKAAMMVVASALERHHSTNNTYETFPRPLAPSYQTAEHYVLDVDPGSLGVLTYTITATGDAVAAGDGACGTLTLNQDHVGTPASCW